MSATFETLCTLDGRLAASGIPPLTAWWRGQIARFYSHPTAHTLVGQVGRGGAKSHTAVKVALNETLFGEWQIPPGERHYWIFLSENKAEAQQRLRLLERALEVLGVAFDRTGDEIALRDLPRGFIVRAAEIGAVSGFRSFGFSADELAKWPSEGCAPAKEVIASANAMTVTHPGAHKLLISSPVSVVDFHYDRFAQGDTEAQIVANAPSWVANPDGISEEQTHELEPDAAVHAREYGARPSAAAGLAFGDIEAMERAFQPTVPGYTYSRPFVSIDPSNLTEGGDGFCYSIAAWALPSRQRVLALDADRNIIRDEWKRETYLPPQTKRLLRVAEIGGWENQELAQTSIEQVVARIAERAVAWGATSVYSDQRESTSLGALFTQRELLFKPYVWSQPSKEEAIRFLRRMLRESTLSIVPHAGMRREMLSLAYRFTRSGGLEYQTRGRDWISTLITIGHVLTDPDATGAASLWAPPVEGNPYTNIGGRYLAPGR